MITWVNASAGSGKTYNLVEEIKLLLAKSIEKNIFGEEILCISFSNAAADEMKNRLSNYPGKILFHTVHSFCNTLYVGLDLIDEIQSETYIKRIIEESLQEKIWFDLIYLLVDEWGSLIDKIVSIVQQDLVVKIVPYDAFVCDMIDLPDYVLEDLRNAKGLEIELLDINYADIDDIFSKIMTKDGNLRKKLYSKKWAEHNLRSKDWLDDFFAKMDAKFAEYNDYKAALRSNSIARFINYIEEKYKSFKIENALLDFHDLIKKVDFTDYSVLEKIMKIRYIFVDEAQDLSVDQWAVILNLYKEIKHSSQCDLYVVGDEKQSIYNFQNNSAALFSRIKSELKDYAKKYNILFQEKDLNTSYRSSQIILDFVDNVMSRTHYKTKHISKVYFGGRVEGHLFKNIETSSITKKIFSLIQRNLFSTGKKITFDDILILVRKRNDTSFRLIYEIENSGIPIKEHLFSIYHNSRTQDLLNIAKFILFKDYVALACLLKNEFFNWNYEDLQCFFEDYDYANILFYIAAKHKNRADTQTIGLCNDDFKSKVEKLCKLTQEWINYPKSVNAFFGKLIFQSEYGQYLLRNYTEDVRAFWEFVNEYEENSWLGFFNYAQNSKKTVQKNSGIRIKTIHSSKGLESPIVIIVDDTKYNNTDMLYYNSEVVFPSKICDKYKKLLELNAIDAEMNDERLIYVALTRAKEQLYIFTVENKLCNLIMDDKQANKDQSITFGLELTKNLKKLL